MDDNTTGKLRRTERLTIPATLGEFTDWLNSYGYANQYDFRPSGRPVGLLNRTKTLALHHKVRLAVGRVGTVCLDITPLEAERLDVAAWTFSQMNVLGRPTPGGENPHKVELENYFDTLVKAICQTWPSTKRRKPIPDNLTPREREVAELVAEGLTSREIADRLVISVRTVEGHRAEINRKREEGDQDREARA